MAKVLIIGGGGAGLVSALCAHETGAEDIDEVDESHVRDALLAKYGNPQKVRNICKK